MQNKPTLRHLFPIARAAEFNVCEKITSAEILAQAFPDTSDRIARYYFLDRSFTDFLELELFQKPFFQKSMLESYHEEMTDWSRRLTLEYPWGEAYISAEPWSGNDAADELSAFISERNPLKPVALAYSLQISLDQHSMMGFWEDEQCDRVPDALSGRTPMVDLVELAVANPSILFGSEGGETYLTLGQHLKGLEHRAGDVFLASPDFYQDKQDLFPPSAAYLCRRSHHVSRLLELRGEPDSAYEFSLPYLLDFMSMVGNEFNANSARLDDFNTYALSGSIQFPETLAQPRSWKYA